MSSTPPDKEKEGERKRDKVGEFLKKNLNKTELVLKHAAGLGHQPNAVPWAEPLLDGPPRSVEVGWHPVGGLAGKWFAQETGLGKLITEKINKYPDPTQHWAVLVGDYAHQLWMDESFDVIYTNEWVNREEWQTFQVGETCFNDDAIRRAGEAVIQSIREKQPAYNLITNNCQTYALQLLDAIKAGIEMEFGTTLTVYETLIGPGKVKDLFSPQDGGDPAAEAPTGEAPTAEGPTAEGPTAEGPAVPASAPAVPVAAAPAAGAPHKPGAVAMAQQVMHDNTQQLDTEEQMSRGLEKKKEKKEKKGFLSRFSRK